MTIELFNLINFTNKREVSDGFEFIFNNCSFDEIPFLSRLIDSIENDEYKLILSFEYSNVTKDYENNVTILKFYK